MAVPLDQYCAELEQADGNNEKILTEDPKLVFKSIQEEKERQERENELEPDAKKAKIDGEGSSKEFFSLPNLPNLDKKEKEEGELEDGEVLDDDQSQVLFLLNFFKILSIFPFFPNLLLVRMYFVYLLKDTFVHRRPC